MGVDVGKLFELQQMDTRIQRAREEVAAMDFGKRVAREAKARKGELDQLEAQLRVRHTDQKDAELELKQLEEKMAKARKKLYDGKITNPKELRALQQEIDSMERHRGALDERALEAMADVERLTAQSAETKKQVSRLVKQYRQQSEEQTARKQELETALSTWSDERKAAAAAIDPGALSRYESRLQSMGGLAVSVVSGNLCSACRVTVASVTVQKLQNLSQIALCDNCGRILYLAQADARGEEDD